jgi:hypothetical protein
MQRNFCILASSYSEGGGNQEGGGERRQSNLTNIADFKFWCITAGHSKCFTDTTRFIQSEN